MMNRWIDPEPCQPDSAVLAACNQDAFLAAILLRRGLRDPQKIRAFLSPDAYLPAPPEQLPDLVVASELLQKAIADGQRILVWGDFDVDGQTATALLVDGLQRLGADVSFYIPSRAIESHGMKLDSLQEQIRQHTPDLLITCDTGVMEYEALDYASSLGLPVIVTDHHDLGDHLPAAQAVINPRRLPADHPLASLPGVGVVYKLMQHLYTTLHRERELPRLLDLVALGIVGDVAMQTDDTRYLLQIGLERLRRTERIGLLALMETASVLPHSLTVEQISYQLGPRLNAAGRLGDAAISVQLLLARTWASARVLAQQLEGYNSERRVQTNRVEVEAQKLIDATPSLLDWAVLVLHQPDWNPGVLGIIASRLAERYRRPVVLLTGADIARGSARTVSGFDIGKAIAAQSDLLRTYGGHAGAAGLSLDVKDIDLFRQRLSDSLAGGQLTAETPALAIDAVVTFDELTLDLCKRIQRLAPFGEGNPPVTLATYNVALNRTALMGFEQKHRRLTVEDSEGRQQTFLWWGGARETLPEGRFDIAYTLSTTENQNLQLALVDFRERESAIQAVLAPPLNIVDWRGDPDPAQRLALILAEAPDSLVWAEAYSRQHYPAFKRRADLTPARTLIVYTIPPDPQTLRDVLARVQPETVHVLGVQPPLASLDAFLAQLAAAARNVIDHLGGKANPELLYGAVAQSPQVVRAGLDYLVACGKIGAVMWRNRSSLIINADAPPASDVPNADSARARLEAAYREVEAFRRYFRTAPLEQLLAR